jgi:hypothetical protein
MPAGIARLWQIHTFVAWLFGFALAFEIQGEPTMELITGLWIVAGLFLLILVPYLVLEIRRGKAHGHTWFTWFKPRGHSDIGPDVGVRYTKPGVDEARSARR